MQYRVAAFIAAAVLAAAVVFTARPAGAVKPFLEQFKAMYEKPNAKDRTMLIFNAAVEKKGCTICHRANSNKTFNAYGEEVKKLLTKSDGNNTPKIKAALGKVSRIRSDRNDSSSQTFGERLRQGKLPVGEIHVRTPDAAE